MRSLRFQSGYKKLDISLDLIYLVFGNGEMRKLGSLTIAFLLLLFAREIICFEVELFPSVIILQDVRLGKKTRSKEGIIVRNLTRNDTYIRAYPVSLVGTRYYEPLPDSSWIIVKQKTTILKGESEEKINFALKIPEEKQLFNRSFLGGIAVEVSDSSRMFKLVGVVKLFVETESSLLLPLPNKVILKNARIFQFLLENSTKDTIIYKLDVDYPMDAQEVKRTPGCQLFPDGWNLELEEDVYPLSPGERRLVRGKLSLPQRERRKGCYEKILFVEAGEKRRFVRIVVDF